ncbi:unnamed protein product [Cuscuta europaea]|uniref:RBR-type E3 ubiquitin transferase n=1 Tax=Cuscuta europaea TaxID=41803 RepID=A0A9P0YPU8_CUSEU|nr:unnamed protein product [Cuscuta europaea]
MVQSDDDLYDVDSPDDDYYGGGVGDVSDGSWSDGDADFVGDDDRGSEVNFTILTGDDIRRLMEDDIAQVIAVLSVSKAEASALLRRYNWSVNRVHEEWFADEEKVQKELGMVSSRPDESSVSSGSGEIEITCGICFDDLPPGNIYASSCSHHFCFDCWRSYIGTAVADGPGCLSLRCPEPSCKNAVNLDAIELLATEEDKKKYFSFLFRSYIEENPKIKWCTAPGCEFAVRFEIGSESPDVICHCGNFFCWNCTEEAHRPVDCETVGKWILKNNAESENTNWILAYTKPCPKCKRPIEKGEGCMRMTCKAPCLFQFCWLCLNDWSVHGYSPCNRYKPGSEADKQKEMAKVSIERYTHYYERWAANEKSKKKALADLQEMEQDKVVKLCEYQSLPETQLKFILEAWKQIIECRRVLKWTYTYGYYLPEGEQTKRQFFEYLQGQAEEGLERLHQCAEKDLEIYLNPEESNSPNFSDFRIKLAGLTSVTKNYFENLLCALENGLVDVDSQSNHCDSSKNGASSTSTSSSSEHAMVSGHNRRAAGWKNRLAGHGNGIKPPNQRNVNTTGQRDGSANNIKAVQNTMAAFTKERRRAVAARLGTPNLNGGAGAAGLNNRIGVGPAQRLNFGYTLPVPTVVGPGLPLAATANGAVGGVEPRLRMRNPKVIVYPIQPNTIGPVPGGVNAPVARGNLPGMVNGGPANWQKHPVNAPRGVGGVEPWLVMRNPTVNVYPIQPNTIGPPPGGVNAPVALGNLQGIVNGGPANWQKHPVNAPIGGRSNNDGAGVDKRFRESSETITTGKVSKKNNGLGTGSSNVASLGNAPSTKCGNPSSSTRSITASSSGSIAAVKKRQRTFSSSKDVSIIANHDNGDLGSWACDLCTFVNSNSASVCTMCAEDASSNWECDKCTFVNKERGATVCQMCELPR